MAGSSRQDLTHSLKNLKEFPVTLKRIYIKITDRQDHSYPSSQRLIKNNH